MYQNVTLVIMPCNFPCLAVYTTVILVQLVSGSLSWLTGLLGLYLPGSLASSSHVGFSHWSAVSLTSTYGIPIPFYVYPGVQG